MSEPETSSFVVEATKMTVKEPLDTWQNPPETETDNLSPPLRAVFDEMAKRGIEFA